MAKLLSGCDPGIQSGTHLSSPSGMKWRVCFRESSVAHRQIL